MTDVWTKKGNGIESFQRLCHEIDNNTKFTEICCDNIELFNIKMSNEDPVILRGLNPVSLEEYNDSGVISRQFSCSRDELIQEFFEESIKTGFLLNVNSQIHYTRPLLARQLMDKLRLKSPDLSKPSLARDAFLAEVMLKRNPQLVLVSKKVGDDWVDGAVVSKHFQRVSAAVLNDVVTKVFRTSASSEVYWKSDFDMLSATVYFRDMAEQIDGDTLVPGCIVRTSDTEKASTSVRAIVQYNDSNSYILIPVSSYDHITAVTSDMLYTDCLKAIQEAKSYLRTMNSLFNANSIMNQEEYRQYMDNTIKALKIDKLIGCQRRADILKETSKTLSGSQVTHCKFKVCRDITKITEKVQMSPYVIDSIALKAAAAPHIA